MKLISKKAKKPKIAFKRDRFVAAAELIFEEQAYYCCVALDPDYPFKLLGSVVGLTEECALFARMFKPEPLPEDHDGGWWGRPFSVVGARDARILALLLAAEAGKEFA